VPTPAPPPAAAAPAQPPLTPEERGDLLMSELRYQAATEAYKQGPRASGRLQNKLGIAYQMLLNLPEAMRCYQASLRLDPGNAKVMNNLATIFDSEQQHGAAERMYRRALKIEPRSAIILKNLGTALMAQHKYKKGAEAYQAALAIDPEIFQPTANPHTDNLARPQDRGAMNYYMARSCARAGFNDRAIDYLRMSLNEGFTNAQKILADNEFSALHGIPAFEQMIAGEQSH
jgi:Tfp pilus assembly protein PilF